MSFKLEGIGRIEDLDTAGDGSTGRLVINAVLDGQSLCIILDAGEDKSLRHCYERDQNIKVEVSR